MTPTRTGPPTTRNGPEPVAQSRSQKSPPGPSDPPTGKEAQPSLIRITEYSGAATVSVKATRKAERSRRAPNVYVSVFGPTKTRKRVWFTGRCRRCGAPVFGAVKALELVAGPRRLTCGHVGNLVNARVYLAPLDRDGAA